MIVDYTGSGRDALDFALSRAPEHLVPPLRAVRDGGCRFMIVAQGRNRFLVPADRPAIVIIGDDLHSALGPAGFHHRSLRRYFSRCKLAAVVACRAVPAVYAAASECATRRGETVAIIETRPEKEADWHDLLLEVSPEIRLILATVPPASSA